MEGCRSGFDFCSRLHAFSASVAHLDRVPGYEPGGKFESFQTRHFVFGDVAELVDGARL